MNQTEKTLVAAARLLVAIAGPLPVHIEMSARGPKKYYDVKRAFSEQDARAHLAGHITKGATLRHPGGMTRALCYDADTPDSWLWLLEAAYRLAACGYRPLLEVSPAGRGGHLWLIYTAKVRADRAQRHAAQVAPTLQHIRECWPGASGHKVRLPGGLYVRPGMCAWCTLYDAQGQLLASDGTGAARVLLAFQTPAAIVPACEEEPPVVQRSGPAPAAQDDAYPSRKTLGPDQRCRDKYGRWTWFQFTPAQLAAWYNERNQVQDILPPEKNGMGLASWRGERRASVGLRTDGWVDFGASARREDGKQDGGDALELQVRVTQEAKPEVLRQIARQLIREARAAMESAAWRGELPPSWVQAFMSDTGWQRYYALRAEAARATQHTGG